MFARLKSYLRRKRTARQFKLLTQAYDDAIDRARARHKPVRGLVQAKREFVHACLRRAA